MKSKFTLCVVLAGLVAVGGPVYAELCTIDDVPAATLLLPYFEVDIDDGDGDGLISCADPEEEGVTTLFSVNNASAAAQLVHVVLWTDWTVPTLDFDVYLTGYDVQTINICDIFRGRLPRTADKLRDAGDAFSPSPPPGSTQAADPWDRSFAGCAGRFPFNEVELSTDQIAHIREAHTGGESPIFEACAGANYGDDVARGYITIDVVNQCSLLFPGQPGYFAPGGTGVASNNNVIWGNYHYVDSANNFAQGETLVHIEAGGTAFDETTVNDTFYSRFTTLGEDNREPLATTFAARYITAGAFTGGTDLVVWREGGIPDFNGFSCGSTPLWHPLNQTQVVCFDEQENGVEICIPGEDRVSPPTGEAQTCFPNETQRVPVNSANPVPDGDDFATVDAIGGWCYLNLNYDLGAGAGGTGTSAPPDPKQAWVSTIFSALGRFSTGMDAIQLDSACTATSPGVFIDTAP